MAKLIVCPFCKGKLPLHTNNCNFGGVKSPSNNNRIESARDKNIMTNQRPHSIKRK